MEENRPEAKKTWSVRWTTKVQGWNVSCVRPPFSRLTSYLLPPHTSSHLEGMKMIYYGPSELVNFYWTDHYKSHVEVFVKFDL